MSRKQIFIAYTVFYLLAVELYLWAAINNWQVNDWIKINATAFVFLGWGWIMYLDFWRNKL